MQNFLTLLGCELRKLLARRALWVAEALLCLVFWSAWSALLFGWAGGYLEYGVFGRGARDFTARVRAAMAAGDLAGRPMDAALLTEADAALRALQSGQADPAEVLGYLPVFLQLERLPDPAARPADWARNFYGDARRQMVGSLADPDLPPRVLAALQAQAARIPEPWPNRLPQAFRLLLDDSLAGLGQTALAALGPVLVLLAGAFPREYATGVAVLQRGARHGRGRLAAAKLLAGQLAALALTALPLAGELLLTLAALGPAGAGDPVQLVLATPYPLTLAQALAVRLLCLAAAALALGAGTLLAGAVFGRAVPALVAALLACYGPAALSLPGGVWDWWPSRLPARIFRLPPVALGPVVLPPWAAFGLGCALWAAAAGALTLRRFSRGRL